MKKNLILLLLAPIFVFGQFDTKNFSVSMSNPYKVIDAYSKYYFSKGNDVLMIKRTKKSFIFQKYNSETKKEELRKEIPNFKEGVVDIVKEVGDKIYLFKYIADRKAKTTSLSYYEVDFKNAKLGSENKLFKVDEYLPYGFYYSGSYDDSKIIVKYRKKTNKEK